MGLDIACTPTTERAPGASLAGQGRGHHVQRVGAVAKDPALILADEPAGLPFRVPIRTD